MGTPGSSRWGREGPGERGWSGAGEAWTESGCEENCAGALAISETRRRGEVRSGESEGKVGPLDL